MKNMLSVQAIWVIRNPNSQLPESCQLGDLIERLHSALHTVHAGLWVNTKPHCPRFASKKVEIDGQNIEAFQVCFNGRADEEVVLETVRGYGFIKYVEPSYESQVSPNAPGLQLQTA